MTRSRVIWRRQREIKKECLIATNVLVLVGFLKSTLTAIISPGIQHTQHCKATVVVSACSANLAWLERDFDCGRNSIHIYARCNVTESTRNIPVSLLQCVRVTDLTVFGANLYGKAHHTYLAFILEEWRALPATLIFLKDLDVHSSTKIKHLPCHVSYASLEPYNDPDGCGIRGPSTSGVPSEQFVKMWEMMVNLSSSFTNKSHSRDSLFVAFRSNFATTANQIY